MSNNIASEYHDYEEMDDGQIESDACNSAEDTDLLEPDSGEPDIQVTAPCTKVCCIDSSIYQPQSSSLSKKTEKVYGSGKHAHKGISIQLGLKAIHGSIFA